MKKNDEKKNTRGGKREGAGRKLVGSAPRVPISLRLEKSTANSLRQYAEANGVAITQVIEDALRGFLGQTHETPTEGF